MSFAGIREFRENLDRLFDSETFKNADDGKRLKLGLLLLRSDYGIGRFMGFGITKKLKRKQHYEL